MYFLLCLTKNPWIPNYEIDFKELYYNHIPSPSSRDIALSDVTCSMSLFALIIMIIMIIISRIEACVFSFLFSLKSLQDHSCKTMARYFS